MLTPKMVAEARSKRRIVRWRAVSEDWHTPVPKKRACRNPSHVLLVEDLFAPMVSDQRIALVMASIASSMPHTFEIRTAHPERVRRWFAFAERQGRKAIAAHKRYTKKWFKDHCHGYDGRYGQQVTEPPTAELRFVYDVAGAEDLKGRHEDCKDGLTNHSLHFGGFSEGEYHWQGWPLKHVAVLTTAGRMIKTGIRYHRSAR